jgi:phosphoribosylamine--glycine ligase
MGTIAPLAASRTFQSFVRQKVVLPVIRGLAAEGTPFKGLLYPGLMVTKDGVKVLEFNARFGDPETQTYMRLLQSDLVALLMACTDGSLRNEKARWRSGYATTVVAASEGYPEEPLAGKQIFGLNARHESTEVFHAGTRKSGNVIFSASGRVLGVSACGTTPEEAKERAYARLEGIQFKGKQYRSDIGADWRLEPDS